MPVKKIKATPAPRSKASQVMAQTTATKKASAKKKPAKKSALGKPVATKTAVRKTAAKAKSPVKSRTAKAKALAKPDPALVREIFTRFQAANPEPKGELEYVNPFTLLVAVVLSAQATDVGVNKATRRLFALADTPEKMLDLGEDRVRDLVKTIGLYRNKAKNVIALSAQLIAEHGSIVPQDREALEKLPGVGRKTANVVLNMAFGHATMAVDTHLFRVSNRIPLARGKTPLAIELGLMAIIPQEFLLHAHHWLILHGRYVCKARTPDCERCIIADLCRSPEKRV